MGDLGVAPPVTISTEGDPGVTPPTDPGVTPPADPADPTPPADPGTANTDRFGDFRDQMHSDIRSNDAFKEMKGMDDLGHAYLDRLDGYVRKPGGEATDEEVNKFYAEMGIPEDRESYDEAVKELDLLFAQAVVQRHDVLGRKVGAYERIDLGVQDVALVLGNSPNIIQHIIKFLHQTPRSEFLESLS